MSSSDMVARVVIVNFPREMFNDALDFADKASQAEERKERFETWRWARLCIICSALCFESYLNQLVQIHASKIRADLDDVKRKSIREKLFNVLPCCGILPAPIDKGTEPYQSLAWVFRLRNELVHYKGDTELYEKELTGANAKRAVEAVRNMILHVNSLSSTETPGWVCEGGYKPIS